MQEATGMSDMGHWGKQVPRYFGVAITVVELLQSDPRTKGFLKWFLPHNSSL